MGRTDVEFDVDALAITLDAISRPPFPQFTKRMSLIVLLVD
jgi:hypothetical protein